MQSSSITSRGGRRTRHSTLSRLAGLATALTLIATGVAIAPAASAQQNPHERGPAPTESSIEALRGPFSVADTRVSSLVSGFGGGTIYYPTDTSQGTFGAIAVSPGYTGTQSTISWLGPRIASQGFVVFTIDTNTTIDQPDSRGRQLLAALDYLVEDSRVRDRIDSNRLGVMGHSMGGGGSLAAAQDRPALQAAIPMTGWHLSKNWSRVQVPTMVIGAENDLIASVRTHSIPFYESLPSSLDKAYLELDGASHFAPNISNTTIAKYSISWLKRFIDDDTRYEQFLCPAPTDREISEYRDTCPHS
ncbi:putative dienelactone hydrolase [Actinoalloteichus hoggarensis]|uniref:Lipase 1 n=1 Tax=Actinoalloteichus hoggarensis TaxID=1470176 RepID=A0A221W6F0_9PSEU|nr:Lipase 1 [Actinoalloteichus hoggarensis]MBB5921247.1 putative dienelactone hydrolase [Actinoalloteichus hoggarensis]